MPAHVKAPDNRPGEGEMKNFFQVMSHRPEIMEAYRPLHEAVMGPGQLEKRIKTIAYLAASYVNESPYDVARAHALAVQEGFSEDDIRAIRTEQNHNFQPMEHAALKIARELTRTCTLDDIEMNELDLFTNPQMVELVSVVAMANFDNRFSTGLEVEKDPTPDAKT